MEINFSLLSQMKFGTTTYNPQIRPAYEEEKIRQIERGKGTTVCTANRYVIRRCLFIRSRGFEHPLVRNVTSHNKLSTRWKNRNRKPARTSNTQNRIGTGGYIAPIKRGENAKNDNDNVSMCVPTTATYRYIATGDEKLRKRGEAESAQNRNREIEKRNEVELDVCQRKTTSFFSSSFLGGIDR